MTEIIRREFLRGVGVVVGSALLNEVGIKPQKKPEQLQPFDPNLVIVDFAPPKRVGGINQYTYPDNRKIIRTLMGKDYVDEKTLFPTLALSAVTSFFDHKDPVIAALQKNPKAAFLYLTMYRYANHGLDVAGILRDTWRQKGFNSKALMIPLQTLFKPESLDISKDNLGNISAYLDVDTEPIIIALKSTSSSQKIVNLSFQLGKAGVEVEIRKKFLRPSVLNSLVTKTTKDTKTGAVRYFIGQSQETLREVSDIEYNEARDKNYKEAAYVEDLTEPNIIYHEAYSRDTALENLPKLFKICNALPDKLFVAALGNVNNDIIEAREKLKDIWPTNLIFVAEWDSKNKQPDLGSVGADIYVDNKALGLNKGSSYSTPKVAAIASVLASQGLTIDQIKTSLFEYNTNITYPYYRRDTKTTVDQSSLLLDFDRVKF